MGPLIGFYVTRLGGGNQFSPPFARGGQGITLSADVFSAPGGGATLTIVVQHKNLEDTTWATFGTFPSITATGLTTFEGTGLKEQIRLSFSVTAGASPQVYDTFHLDMLAPVWRP